MLHKILRHVAHHRAATIERAAPAPPDGRSAIRAESVVRSSPG